MTLDDSKTWRKKKSPSKPKLSDHATHLLTDSSQSPGQGHSSCARPLGRDPRESNLSLFIAPSPVRERGPVATGWQTTAPSTCDSVCPHCQKKKAAKVLALRHWVELTLAEPWRLLILRFTIGRLHRGHQLKRCLPPRDSWSQSDKAVFFTLLLLLFPPRHRT